MEYDPEIHIVSAMGAQRLKNESLGSYNRLPEDELRKRVLAVAESRSEASAAGSTAHFYVHTRIGDPAAAILGAARDVQAEMIIVGTHSKKGVRRLLLGSVSEKIVREADCPVLVLRELTYGVESAGLQPEPPCGHCLSTRANTNGQSWWCSEHDHAPPYTSPLRSKAPASMEESRRAAWPLI